MFKQRGHLFASSFEKIQFVKESLVEKTFLRVY